MKFPNKGTVEKLRKVYPVGTRVELVSMDDFQAPPLGTKGIVKGVDDTGSPAEFINRGGRIPAPLFSGRQRSHSLL